MQLADSVPLQHLWDRSKRLLVCCLHIQHCSTAEIILTLPKPSHIFLFPRKMSFLPYKKTQSWLPGVSLPSELCWEKKIKCPFVPWKAIADPIILFFPLCNLYIGFQWNTPSANLLCMWRTASSALTLFLVNKETEFPIHRRINHFIFWINESVIYSS